MNLRDEVYDTEDNIIKRLARLIAHGVLQMIAVKFDVTYARRATMDTLTGTCLLSIVEFGSSSDGGKMTALSKLDETKYILPPPGIQVPAESYFCFNFDKKALYQLKQSTKQSFKVILIVI